MNTRTHQHRGLADRVRELVRRAGAQPVTRADAYGVLRDARAVIERGWVQGRWVVDRPSGDDVAAACLVGAVVHTVRRRGATDDLTAAGPALDLLWDAWNDSRGLGGPGVAGLAAPPAVRTARVRDLTRWNDQPGRTRADVLGLLDVAADRAIRAGVGADQCPAGRRRPVPGGSSSPECSGSRRSGPGWSGWSGAGGGSRRWCWGRSPSAWWGG